jgi:hypothetical protein
MSTEEHYTSSLLESRLRSSPVPETLLLQIKSDRRLGHEWDDWDGEALPSGGVFDSGERLFFTLALLAGAFLVGGALLIVWLVGPRLSAVWPPLQGYTAGLVLIGGTLWVLWLAVVRAVIQSGRNWLPERLAERGLLPWCMPALEKLAMRLGWSRDRAGNAMLRVFNRLSIARVARGTVPEDLLILLPRCLSKEAMQQAMRVSERYGVPVFVAARGRYARQMIAMRRPKAVVAVACERDLVSGVHDVAKRLPVLGTTLQLGEGPCRNTAFQAGELERQVRTLLGLGGALD